MKQILGIVLVFCWINGFSQDTLKDERIKPFIAYDFGQAVFNKFQSLSGEIGLRLKNRHLIRLTHMNLNYTEEHLSSKKAIPLLRPFQGKNIKGSIFGFELMYSIPTIKWKQNTFYLSPSVGHYKKRRCIKCKAGSPN